MSLYLGCIKVNLPIDSANFTTGNGEGVWIKVAEKTANMYDSDHYGGLFKGELANDSLYYPNLKCGDTILFTMRGGNKPVAIYHGFLENLNGISAEEKDELIKRIIEHDQ